MTSLGLGCTRGGQNRVRGLLIGGALLSALTAVGCGDDAKPNGSALCEIGETNCGGVCASLASSPDHCGTCGNACPTAPAGADAVCVNSVCGIECRPGGDAADGGDGADGGDPIEKTLCDDACVDLASDLSNCGSCGEVCTDPTNGDPLCNGACSIECDTGYTPCGMECSNLLVDGDHCGACGTACVTNEVCANGTCVLACPSGQARCGNVCVDIAADPDNCGGCGNACAAPANGSATCTDNVCGIACNGSFSACNGACVETDTDVNHCGTCATQCSAVNGTPSCTGGNCAIACDALFANCDGMVNTGCEASLTSEATCGSCATTCGSSTPFCNDQGSNIYACDAGCDAMVCDSGLSTQRCVSLATTVSDCGSCGTACPEPTSGDATGDATCSSSLCGVNCSTPTATTVTRGGDLACVDTASDPQACGGGLVQCGLGERCQAGACVKDLCAPGLTKTDTGCVNLQSDGSNCGDPDATCSGTIVPITGCSTNNCLCDVGECRGNCGGGRTVCDTRDCVDTATDPAHCGACGQSCTAGQFCKGGACRDFIYASGAWECGADNTFSKACPSNDVNRPAIVCVGATAPCP